MTNTHCYPHLLPMLLSFFSLVLFVDSVYIQRSGFGSDDADILYLGSAGSRAGAVQFNMNARYTCQVGWAIYARRVKLWDSNTGRVTDFTSHYSFTIDTQDNINYGYGLCFFLAPFGFKIPPNSASGFLGIYNASTGLSRESQIVHVEFDSYANAEWGETMTHVGINNNSVISSVSTYWNTTLHSNDPADVWITYNSTSKNFSVSWKYQNTHSPQENTSLSYLIDLSKALPEWVTVGFSAATGPFKELHTLLSWEFNSTLDDTEQSKNKTSLTVVLSTVLVSVVLIVGGAIVAYALLWRKKKTRSKKEDMNLTSMNDVLEREAGPRRFSRRELAKATNNFSEDRKLGQGGFGAVYRGYFPDIDLTVAVKKISRGSRQGKREYVTEVRVISQLRHRNLVQLIGWCHERGEFLLVYEFMPNGSLDAHLSGKKPPLPWNVRHKIALGLASGVLYLHEEWQQCVVHRDVKTSNVMLDSSFNAKLGDFGLAKLVDHDLGPQTTGLAGTMGYMAPEYVSTGRASKESDVYSFGVVALEIVTGRKANDLMKDGDGVIGLIEWVWNHYGRGELALAMDEKLQEDYNKREVEYLMIVGLWCAHPDKNMRPSIRQAIQVLCFEVALPYLPSKRPIPIYHAPKPKVISEITSLTTTLQTGR
ncbi:L-type lectin-domain containing receptor kinase IX.1-like [Prosopis cineraria]|uniref:L-type lectin-domain containing receptor kinase IX.1-like n=1 Tax=Prosopis cineraria TaxID=364024 RepID=UPI00240ED57E|nr:L-type lectin-domain containing receptor kinase IX.1-like [Prosopis cineraria]